MPDPKKLKTKQDSINYVNKMKSAKNFQDSLDLGLASYQLSDTPGMSGARRAAAQKKIDSTVAAHRQRIMNIEKKLKGN